MDIFVSVGSGLSSRQEAFVSAVEERLRLLGLNPRTIGRNAWSADAPLQAVTDLMKQCSGAVVLALERFQFAEGVERRGSIREGHLRNVCMPTAWNQIEAAMAYDRGLPLLVVVDENVRGDGLLEKGNDWYVLELPIDPASLSSAAFAGILENWRNRLGTQGREEVLRAAPPDLSKMTLAQLIGTLRPAQLWATLGALAVALGAAFALGATLIS